MRTTRAMIRVPRSQRPATGRIACAGLALVLVAARRSDAVCNTIPGTTQTFRATQTTIDRPFAGPGDVVTLGLDPTCYPIARSFSLNPVDQVVTVIFTPPGGGSSPRNVVVLAADCSAVGICPGVASTACVPANQPDQAVDLEVMDPLHMRVRFPDTDAVLRSATDALTFAGPATLAVTRVGDPLPCALASHTCEEEESTLPLLACADDLFAADGTCDPTPHPVFPHFTALPFANDYQAMCATPSPPCTGTTGDFRFTVDTAGNLLLPMDWRGVLVNRDLVPVPRLLRGSAPLEAMAGGGTPMRVPGAAFLGSFTPEGRKLPPIFEPQADPMDLAATTLFGSADAPLSILRIARRVAVPVCVGGTNAEATCTTVRNCPQGICTASFRACAGGAAAGQPCVADGDCAGGMCGAAACVGGGNAGQVCHTDADCPGGECGLGLFDFTDRFLDRVGPVVLRRGTCIGGSAALTPCAGDVDCPGGQCGTFLANALDPVPLDGLVESASTFAFVKEEAIEEKDLNGDDDATDHVVTLVDRTTGQLQSIGVVGAQGRAEGRAVARIRQPPFSFPAVAVEGTVAAFLEPEPAQGNRDENHNGQVFETILRVFRLGGAELTSDGAPITADVAPLIDGRSLALSNGRIFFRTAEAAAAHQETERADVAPDGAVFFPNGTYAISPDGRFVVFEAQSPANNLIQSIYLRDRSTGATEIVSIASDETVGNDASFFPQVSSGGRFVAFTSLATNLVQPDMNANGQPFGGADVFVHDRLTGLTERVSVASDGTEGNAESGLGLVAISADGRFVAFDSQASNLVDADLNGVRDVFVHDRATHLTERVSVATDGTPGNGESLLPSLSADGQVVAFYSVSTNLGGAVPGSIYIRDRANHVTETVASGQSPSISADGRFVAFASTAALVPGDTNDREDVFTYDRTTHLIERVSVASDGSQADGVFPSISADGRFVLFRSEATTLTKDCLATSAPPECVFVHDRLTGATVLVSVAPDVESVFGPPEGGRGISGDGRVVVFFAVRYLEGSSTAELFIREPRATDGAADLSGDGDLDDTVLRMLDTAAANTGSITLGPATAVAMSNGAAAFLRPEDAGAPGQPSGSDLNGDGDTTDDVIHLWPGRGPVLNLGWAATAVALSDRWLAALVSEDGQHQTDLNRDRDTSDTVVQVAPVTATSAVDWTNVGQAADSVDVAGGIVAFITPEAAQGNTDLNGDGDASDRVLQVYDADAQHLLMGGPRAPVPAQAADDFVLGPPGSTMTPPLVAFRASEITSGHDVLEVFDPAAGVVCDSHQAITRCFLEACDPRIPYRVLNDTVTFLTFEAEQGEDLNGDGDTDDLVLQTFNVAMAEGAGMCSPSGAIAAAAPVQARTQVISGSVQAGLVTTLAAATAGVCTNSGTACAVDANCAGGTCFVPPGGCIVNLGTTCNPAVRNSCPTGQFCQPTFGTPGQGTCRQVQTNPDGSARQCASTADCIPPAACNAGNQNFNRLVAPLVRRNGGTTVFTGAGHCVELGAACQTTSECGHGEFCNGKSCERERGPCRVCAPDDPSCPRDCPAGSSCQQGLVVHALEDRDGDEIPDVFDNCPTVPNPDQRDANENHVGDACESSTIVPNRCPQAPGFWKNHPSVWPVMALRLGNQTYTQTELLAILNAPIASPPADASLILADPLIAAKLSIAGGSNPAPIASTIADADRLLSGFAGKLSYHVRPPSPIGKALLGDANLLRQYTPGASGSCVH